MTPTEQANLLPRAFRLGDLVIDLDRESLRRGQETIELPELSFRLLAALASHAPERVSKNELIREVWGDVVVGDETLAQRVSLLRQALGDDSQDPRYISSVRGHGYRLVCDVRPAGENSPPGRRRWVLPGLLAAVIVAVTVWFGTSPTEQAHEPAARNLVAVLPFADLSEDQDYRYFGDGMQEELLTRLAGIDSLRVSSRTSVEQYRGTKMSIPDIAAELGVDAVIEGSVRIHGGEVRTTVQLIDAKTDQHLWANTYDRQLTVQNIFAIQEEVASEIAAAMRVEYKREEAAVLLPTANLDAYSAYLLGRFHTFRQTPDDLALAIRELQRATMLDPDFAEAYAALGWAYSFLGTGYGLEKPADVYPKAKEAALKALALDANFADARTLYADILTWYDWDFVAAEREYRKTLAIDPLNVLGYALFLTSQERHDEALELIERRVRAHPDDAYVRVNAAWRFLGAERYERAVSEAELAGDHPDAMAVLAFAWLSLGNDEKAIDILRADLKKRGSRPAQLSNLAATLFLAGHNSEAQNLLQELEAIREQEYFSPALLSSPYFAAGDADRGFELMQEAIDLRTREVIFLRVNHFLNDYREDPRYFDLLRQVGLGS